MATPQMTASMARQGLTPSTSSPSQVANSVSSGIGGAVTAAGQTNSAGTVIGAANPHDALGYNPAKDPTSTAFNSASVAPTDTSAAGATAPTTQINTAQPTPTSVTQNTGVNNPLAGSTQATPLQPTDQAPQGLVDQFNGLKQKYTQAVADIKATGTTSPSSSGSAGAGINAAVATQPKATPAAPTTTPAVDNYYNPETNPAIAESTKQVMDFIAPQATRDDLAKSMSTLMADKTELSSEKLQLMNIKNIMSGTVDDIRSEITAAGGFASESQVQALAVSRNQTLLKQATLLQDQVQSQQDQVANDTTLLNFEKDMANTQASQRMGILQYQRENYQYQQTAQRTSLSEMQKTEGWNGIYAAALASGDPQAISRINQAMGQGFDLATAAKNDTTTAKNAAELASTRASTANTQVNTQKTLQEINDSKGLPTPAKANAVGYNAQGVKYNNALAASEVKSELGNLGKRNLIPPAQYNQAKSWWVQQGLKDSDFDSIFGGQKDASLDKTGNKQYN